MKRTIKIGPYVVKIEIENNETGEDITAYKSATAMRHLMHAKRLARANAKLIRNSIPSRKFATAATISKKTGLHIGTVRKVIKNLMRRSIVEYTHKHGNIGRPAMAYRRISQP